jgi:hypothetical protein
MNIKIDKKYFRFEEGFNTDILVICFSGARRRGLDDNEYFEWTRFFEKNNYKCHLMFLSDYHYDDISSWYTRFPPYQGEKKYVGVKGFETFFKDIKKKYNVKKIILLGFSIGGYASLLYGNLINANVVLSFVPQTLLYDSEFPHTDKIQRWYPHTCELYLKYLSENEKKICKNLNNIINVKHENFFVIYSDYEPDIIYANNLDFVTKIYIPNNSKVHGLNLDKISENGFTIKKNIIDMAFNIVK